MIDIKNPIRQQISEIFRVLIPKNQWDAYLAGLDKEGHPNRVEMLKIITAYGKQIEVLEDLVKNLSFQVDMIQGKTATYNPDAVMKLRTISDIYKELEEELKKGVKSLYLTKPDFGIMYESIPEKDKKSGENGYFKEIDPIDGKEKTCMMFRNTPVFMTN